MINRCFTYVLPSINETLNIKRELLVNCYLRTKNFYNPEYFFILFKYNEDYVNYLKNHPQIIELLEYDENILVKIKLNLIQQEINKLYIEGQYSKFPLFYKDKILKYFNLPKSSEQYKILHKLPVLKHQLEKNLNVKLSENSELGIKTNIKEESLE